MSHAAFCDGPNGEHVVIIHNGDWSGDAEISLYPNKDCGRGDRIAQWTLPGWLVKDAFAQAAISVLFGKMKRMVNDLTDDEVASRMRSQPDVLCSIAREAITLVSIGGQRDTALILARELATETGESWTPPT